MDSSNQFAVGVKGDRILFSPAPDQFLMRQPLHIPRLELTREQALNLGAWLVTLADPTGEEFEKLRQEIQK